MVDPVLTSNVGRIVACEDIDCDSDAETRVFVLKFVSGVTGSSVLGANTFAFALKFIREEPTGGAGIVTTGTAAGITGPYASPFAPKLVLKMPTTGAGIATIGIIADITIP